MTQLNTRQLDIINPASFFSEGAGQFINTENQKRQIGAEQGMQARQLEAQRAAMDLQSKDAMDARMYDWQSTLQRQRHEEKMSKEARDFATMTEEKSRDAMLRTALLSQQLMNMSASHDADAAARIQQELDSHTLKSRQDNLAAQQALVSLVALRSGASEMAAKKAAQQVARDLKTKTAEIEELQNTADSFAPKVIEEILKRSPGFTLKVDKGYWGRGAHFLKSALVHDVPETRRMNWLDDVEAIAARASHDLNSGKTREELIPDFVRNIQDDLKVLGVEGLPDDQIGNLIGLEGKELARRLDGMRRETETHKAIFSTLGDAMTSLAQAGGEGDASKITGDITKIVEVLKGETHPAQAMDTLQKMVENHEISDRSVRTYLHLIQSVATSLRSTAGSDDALEYAASLGPLAAHASAILGRLEPTNVDVSDKEEEYRKQFTSEEVTKALEGTSLDESLGNQLESLGFGDLAKQLQAEGLSPAVTDQVRRRLSDQGTQQNVDYENQKARLEADAVRNKTLTPQEIKAARNLIDQLMQAYKE